MKNIELYRTIEKLVEAKQEKCTPAKPVFAINYCKQQLKKKKLLPYNPRTKMNRIMKNFNQLENYINIEDLFNYVYKKASEKKKDDSLSSQPAPSMKREEPLSVKEKTLKKAQQYLGPFNQERDRRQNQKMKALIEDLEKHSVISGAKRKNNHPWLQYSSFDNFNEQSQIKIPEKWNFYQGKINQQKNNQKQNIRYKQTLRHKKQSSQLLHQVTTYLQIVLEHQHKKKWGKYQNFRQRKIKTRKSFDILKKTKQQVKQASHQKQNFSLTLEKSKNKSAVVNKLKDEQHGQESFITSIKPSPQKKKVKQTFTFRKRNVKQKILRKISQFLDLIQSEEKSLKQEKSTCLNQINKLEAKLKTNYSQCARSSIMADDGQIQILKRIVMQQK